MQTCKVLKPCANQQVLETRRRRWWECPAGEHLRPPWFRALRPQLDEFPQCFVQCAIGCSGYDGPALDLVQKVFLDIQLAVNRHQNSFGSASQEGWASSGPTSCSYCSKASTWQTVSGSTTGCISFAASS